MKALTFLGTTNYSTTTYAYKDQTCTTEFFAEALPVFFPQVDEILVFATPQVQAHPNLAELQRRLGARLRPVPIPDQHSEADLWAIFDALTGSIAEGDAVLFDITNSFRSLPFLVFLAAAFLRTARRVRLEGVVYGAWEARDEQNRSPVFDLTPFIGLLDWLTATNQFIYTGNAAYLARLLSEAGRDQGSGSLKAAGSRLEELSLAMMLCRPFEVMERAGGLGHSLHEAADDLAAMTRPFNLLAERIQREYAGRSLPEPERVENIRPSLRQQLDLIRWYLDNNQVIQGVTLAREWVVSAVGWQLGLGYSLRSGDRRAAEEAVNGVARVGQVRDGVEFTLDDLTPQGRALWSHPARAPLRELWNQLQGVRNDLDHAGMNPSRMKAEKLARKAQEVIWPLFETFAGLILATEPPADPAEKIP